MAALEVSASPGPLPTLDDIQSAAVRLEGRIVHTPLLWWEAAETWLKPECLQRSGSFKLRGALERILTLDSGTRARGVVAFSSGNHAQGVALAARMVNVPATIVMPGDSLPHKVRATRAHGARVVQEGVTVGNRAEVAARVAVDTGGTLIPPFDDPHVMAGQGTIALEILADLPTVGTLVVPLGGGGLLGGISIAARALRPDLRIIGVEPAAGNDGQQSLREGRRITISPPTTIADGARTLAVGVLPFEAMRTRVDEVVTVDDDALRLAVARLALEARIVAEPTGALAVAAVLTGVVRPHGPTCVVVSGGNVAPLLLAEVLAAHAGQAGGGAPGAEFFTDRSG